MGAVFTQAWRHLKVRSLPNEVTLLLKGRKGLMVVSIHGSRRAAQAESRLV